MTHSDHSLAFPADSSLHWEGHMYDGIATSYGRTPGATLHAHADALWLKGTRGDFFLPRQDIVLVARWIRKTSIEGLIEHVLAALR